MHRERKKSKEKRAKNVLFFSAFSKESKSGDSKIRVPSSSSLGLLQLQIRPSHERNFTLAARYNEKIRFPNGQTVIAPEIFTPRGEFSGLLSPLNLKIPELEMAIIPHSIIFSIGRTVPDRISNWPFTLPRLFGACQSSHCSLSLFHFVPLFGTLLELGTWTLEFVFSPPSILQFSLFLPLRHFSLFLRAKGSFNT